MLDAVRTGFDDDDNNNNNNKTITVMQCEQVLMMMMITTITVQTGFDDSGSDCLPDDTFPWW